MKILEIQSLTKRYGSVCGVKDISFDIGQGEIFGYLGPNGSGKTTTIRIFLDFIRPSSGRARLFGLDSHVHSSKIKSRIGYVPGEYGIYEEMRGAEYLRFFGALRGCQKPPLRDRLIDIFGLDISKRIKSYSHGTRQKLAVVQAFMHDPELLILDEPTIGLDPLMQQRFYELLLEMKNRGKTVFLSSHILSEVEKVCDRVGILKEGELVAIREISEIKRLRLRSIEITFKQEVNESVFRLDGVRKVERDGNTIQLWVDSNINGILRTISEYPVENMSFRDASLEDIFMEYYSE
ncbi:MAG: ABC transporter ATP-binding protein [Phycisphaerales bacterium]|nr:MAG: ABC transporter ATP-binding protein [Phycisphaerales bacterium]